MRQASFSLRRTYSPRWTTGAFASSDTAVASNSVCANAASGWAFASARNSIVSFARSGTTSSIRERAAPSVRCARSPVASRRASPLNSPSSAARSSVGARNAVSYRSSIVRRTASAGPARSAGWTRSPADPPVTRPSRIESSGVSAAGEPDGPGSGPVPGVSASLDVHAGSAHANASRSAITERRVVMSDRKAYGTNPRSRVIPGRPLMEGRRLPVERLIVVRQVLVHLVPVRFGDVDPAAGSQEHLHGRADAVPHDPEPAVDQLVMRELVGLLLVRRVPALVLPGVVRGVRGPAARLHDRV